MEVRAENDAHGTRLKIYGKKLDYVTSSNTCQNEMLITIVFKNKKELQKFFEQTKKAIKSVK